MSNNIDNEDEESRTNSSNKYYESEEVYSRIKDAQQEFKQGKGITFTMKEFEEYIYKLVGNKPL